MKKNYDSRASLYNSNSGNKGKLSLLQFTVIISLFLLFISSPEVKGQIVTTGDDVLTSLLTEIHPSLYLVEGDANAYGDSSPEVLFCDVNSVSMLYDYEELFEHVQLIRIQIKYGESLPEINLSNLVGFQNLKYFYVEFTYDICGTQSDDCLEGMVQQNISNAGTEITVLEKLSISK